MVYLLECCDGTYYTGCTNNLEHRIKTHNSGKGAKYTKYRRPVKLIGFKDGFSHGDALRFEHLVKKKNRSQKAALFFEKC